MTRKTDTAILIFLLCVISFFIYRDFIRPQGETPAADTVFIVDTIPGDTVLRVIYQDRPRPVYIDTGSTIIIPANVDTNAILRDYFAKVYYSDTLNDTSYRVVIRDTVTENRIAWRQVQFQNLRPTVINRYTITNDYGDGFYPGIGVSYGEKASLNLGVIYKNKSRWMFGITGYSGGMSGMAWYRIGR